MSIFHTPSNFDAIHEEAPEGSPDKYVTTQKVTFSWIDVPKAWRHLNIGRFIMFHPYKSDQPVEFIHSRDAAGAHTFKVSIPEPFYFAVSVAPSFRRARPGACLHDLLYQMSNPLAELLGEDEEDYLDFADAWFRGQMKASSFTLYMIYYKAVSWFGYPFHLVTSWWNNRKK